MNSRAWPAGDGGMAQRIRTYNWGSTPLGPVASWPQSLTTAVDLMLVMPQPACVCWGSEGRLLYNDAYGRLLGGEHPGAFAKAVAELRPELTKALGPPLMAGCAERAQHVCDHHPARCSSLAGTWTPLCDVTGHVGGFFFAGTSARSEAAETSRTAPMLCASEEQFRALLENCAQAVWETDADGLLFRGSPSWCAYTGQTFEDSRGTGWMNAIHPDDRARADCQWREAVAARRNFDTEIRLRHIRRGPIVPSAFGPCH